MIDPTTKRVPVLQRLIATTKTVPTREVYELFYRTFNELMNYSYQHGFRFIPDDVFIAAGFPEMPKLLAEPSGMQILHQR
mmetsp:Transcript_26445/g.47676  ORF Transcript_26445/g.47676 Transcript_26445/m.47676 type:complete len:80 (+) Transcript_26445:1574-1813(+)